MNNDDRNIYRGTLFAIAHIVVPILVGVGVHNKDAIWLPAVMIPGVIIMIIFAVASIVRELPKLPEE